MVSSRGVPSSKRIITIIAFLLMATGFISNLFFNLVIDEFIYDSMKWIVIGGLGFTASEQFARGGTRIATKIGKDANKPTQHGGGYGGGYGGYGGGYGGGYDNGYGEIDDDYEFNEDNDRELKTPRKPRRKNKEEEFGDDQQGDGPPIEQIPN